MSQPGNTPPNDAPRRRRGNPNMVKGAPSLNPSGGPRGARRTRTLSVVDEATVLDRFNEQRLFRAWIPRAGLPGPTRASCPPATSPCPYVRCRHHLAMVSSPDRPGRRVPGKVVASTLVPLWLDATAPTCALALVERAQNESWGMRRASREMGMVPSRFFDVLSKVLAKVRASGVDLGG